MPGKYLMNCPDCDEKFEVDFSDAESEKEVFDEDRGMGAEYQNTYTKYFDCPNEKCGEALTAILETHEYPLGAPEEVYNPPYFV